jgi:hypothetical protein
MKRCGPSLRSFILNSWMIPGDESRFNRDRALSVGGV